MPQWLAKALVKNGYVSAHDMIPVLAQLLEHSSGTVRAYLCHPCVQHISKLRREGGFCGYRNIQMLISYIIGAKAFGAEVFGNRVPSVFDIQDLIEAAWDMGHNPQGRIETGGIKGTRKFIGTSEAQALFNSLQIPSPVQSFRDSEDGAAASKLLQAIDHYFKAGCGGNDESKKVQTTSLPPVYLQHQGHSLTVVGIEERKDGRLNLLVFDPSCRDSAVLKRHVGRRVCKDMAGAGDLAEPYRRGAKYLIKQKEFEILCLSSKTRTSASETL
ncbi:hypothetical protein JDV02_005395 [Purpureocillium takamizusanense]|nr:uncharacterized protein JDV02_005395 [Purpureocillium takamizusanense]UNI19192.1 hypothetical protein JDV02_005395 [Purpureocillium takamizusanense]